jgi:predicted nucleic acid-binding protein
VIVADASVVVELLAYPHSRAGLDLGMRIEQEEAIHAPHLLDAEVGQTLRRLAQRGEMTAPRAAESLEDLASLPIGRYAHGWLLPRAFELRSNVTIYDGLYLALAEALDVPLLTCDSALQGVPGCRAEVEVLPPTPAALD